MRCAVGDLAWIVKSLVPSNIRKIVEIKEYIGYFEGGSGFQHRGIFCKVPITDHYWWIECKEGIDTFMGPMNIAVGPDTWLEPIKPDLLDGNEETGDEVYNIITEETVE